ncbi:hypothetical protein LAV78_01055 [Brucella intermedia]|uniref:hypothetical protein n=1 Tax=Brucella intermedia TaxID=94625 RepID=UPI001E45FB02|nr:hypothetical protein [Brucella intermedia]MCB4917113.1 hypothetical protein [Brucella intermedia]
MENFAYAYIHFDEATIRGISFVCLLAGCAINYLTNRSAAPMARSSYFFATAALVLASSVEGLIWLAAPSAIASGKLVLVVLVELSALTALGYFFGFAATGRSVDAYGTTGKWWLAFIPLINLILLFKPSQNPSGKTGGAEMTKTVALVIGAFVLLAGGRALAVSIEHVVEGNTQAAAKENPLVAERLAQAALDNGKLADLLVIAAREVAVPVRLDEITTLSKVSARGNEMRFHYTLSGDISSIPDSFAANLQRTFCAGPLKDFIRKGATVTADYEKEDGTSVRAISVDGRECDSL